MRHFSLEIALPKSSPTTNNVAIPVVIVAFCLQVLLLFIVCSVFIFYFFFLRGKHFHIKVIKNQVDGFLICKENTEIGSMNGPSLLAG